MTQIFTKLPPTGAWKLLGAYEGFEVVRFAPDNKYFVLKGTTLGAEEGLPWSIHYTIKVDEAWHVRHATVANDIGDKLDIQTDGTGSWEVNGEHHPELDGCLDLDFEASSVTNTLPVHRLALAVEQQGESAAVYIRSQGLAVERLDQTYLRLPDADGKMIFDYASPRFGYHDKLRFAPDGLVEDYPGIGKRIPLKSQARATWRS